MDGNENGGIGKLFKHMLSTFVVKRKVIKTARSGRRRRLRGRPQTAPLKRSPRQPAGQQVSRKYTGKAKDAPRLLRKSKTKDSRGPIHFEDARGTEARSWSGCEASRWEACISGARRCQTSFNFEWQRQWREAHKNNAKKAFIWW